MVDPPQIFITGAPINVKICTAFAKGCNGRIISEPIGERIATYGIKRRSDIAIKQAKEYWYIDHGYFGRSTNPYYANGYYRITKNALIHNGQGNFCKKNIYKFLTKVEPYRKTGNIILLCVPSGPVCEFYGIDQQKWITTITTIIRQYSDRPIILSEKQKNPANQFLDTAWVLVTFNSNALVDAMIKGVPVISINKERLIGSLKDIENPPLIDREQFLSNLIANQWTLSEMEDGTAWRELNDSS